LRKRRARAQNRLVHASAVYDHRIAPSPPTASAVVALLVYECERDGPRVAMPRPEIQLVVRFGPSTRNGLDVHAMGVGRTVHRKHIRSGQRAVTARLRLGVQEAVLGVPASAVAGRIVALEELWGAAATRRLHEQLADARDAFGAAAILESAIAERLATAHANGRRAGAQLALAAADRLTSANVNAVAVELGVSERHLRRVFRETVGVSPKTFAKLSRFHRALRAARENEQASWATIAVAAGYYDQAHLIAEFRAIAGVTPRALLGELRADPSLG
jgi:AraC-like DNA-binding protein